MTIATELVAQLRALIETVRTSDLDQAAAGGVDLQQLAAQWRAQVNELAPFVVATTPTQIGLHHDSAQLGSGVLGVGTDGSALEIFPYSPIIGLLNPVAPPISLWRDGDVVRGSGRIPTGFNGPPGAVHGGFVAAVLDELLGMAAVVAGVGGFTGTLTVRYLRPTPIATDLQLEAQVERSDGRKTVVRGQIAVAAPEGGHVCATAEATFIRPTSWAAHLAAPNS